MFGAGTVQWSWGLDDHHDRGNDPADVAHAAGDGEPVRRHGRAARDAAGRARRGDRVDRRDARRPRRSPRRRPARRVGGADHRARAPRADAGGGASAASRSRSTAARPGTPRPGATTWSYTCTPAALGRGHDPRPRGRRQRRTSRRPAPAITVDGSAAELPVHRSGTTVTVPTDAAENDPQAGRARREVPRRERRLHHRRCASTRAPANTRHARRAPVDRRGHAARQRDVHRRDGDRLAGGRALARRSRSAAEHDLRRVVPHRPGLLRGRRELLRHRRVDNPPLHALAERRGRRQRRVPLRRRRRFPTSTYQASNYWVDVVFETEGTPPIDVTPPDGRVAGAPRRRRRSLPART